MCGLVSIIGTNGGRPDPEVLARMAGCIRHRGPDDEGSLQEDAVAFYHLRLSIIDLASGKHLQRLDLAIRVPSSVGQDDGVAKPVSAVFDRAGIPAVHLSTDRYEEDRLLSDGQAPIDPAVRFRGGTQEG